MKKETLAQDWLCQEEEKILLANNPNVKAQDLRGGPGF